MDARTLWQVDGLRLLGLSRIERCADCARFHALKAAHRNRSALDTPPPAVPELCRYQVCEPMVDRYCGSSGELRRPAKPAAPLRSTVTAL